MTWLALVTCLSNRMWQKCCSGISETRSQKLCLLPGSPGKLTLGALNHHMSDYLNSLMCGGRHMPVLQVADLAEASLPAIPLKAPDV